MSTSTGFRHYLWTFFKYGISALCLIYAFKGVPFPELGAVLRRYPALPMLWVLIFSFSAYAVMGLRLSYMTNPPLTFRSTFSATLVGLALNNVFPAKAGEIAKAVWMGRENEVPFQKTLGLVFMERFFDVNVLGLLSLWFLWSSGKKSVVGVFALCLVAGWFFLIIFRRYPALQSVCLSLLGKGRLRDFASQFLDAIIANVTPKRLLWLTTTSAILWSLYLLNTYAALNWVAQLGLSRQITVSVFAISSLGMLLPSSPGAIGVYEAFSVTVLKYYGVPQEEALAVALFNHMAQFIPVTLSGGLIFLASPQREKEEGTSQTIEAG